MAGSTLMSVGTRAMFAAYAQLTTTGNNIANANTPGYSRQKVELSATEGQFTGSGFFGRGVSVQTVSRATNVFLTQQASATRADASADAARRDLLQQVEKIFGRGTAGIGHAATQLFNAFADLAAAPADLSARQAVLARAEDLGSTTRAYSDQIASVQANISTDIENSVREVNELTQQVASLNGKIVDALGSGHEPNDLLDARDQLISRISAKIDVNAIAAPDGSVSVFIAGGQSLVLSQTVNKLVSRADEFDPQRTGLSISVGGQVTPLSSGAVGAGALAGLLRAQNDDLVEVRNRLGQMAAGLAVAMNTQQSYGIDLAGSTGAAMFAYGAPVAMPSSTNAAVGPVFLANVSLAITNPAVLQASEYLLINDPANPGQYQVTRQSDGQVFSGVASGAVIDGFSITMGVPAPAAGDRFLLKPVSNAAGGMDLLIGNPRALAAAAPITAVAASANTGTAAVAAVTIVTAPGAAYQPLSVRFTNANGAYDLVDAANVVQASGTWTAGTPISFNGFELSLQGRPALGDRFDIAPTAYPAASNGNALAFDSMASRLLIDGQTFADTYAQMLSEVGVRVQGAQSAADTSSAVATRASEALSSEVGVNLDEEAAKLIEYQQAYQAAAKMLQTAQTVLETLIQMGGH